MHKEELQLQLKRKNLNFPIEWIDAVHLLQIMRMLQTLSKGWDEMEYEKILRLLDQRFKISPKIRTVSNIKLLKLYTNRIIF